MTENAYVRTIFQRKRWQQTTHSNEKCFLTSYHHENHATFHFSWLAQPLNIIDRFCELYTLEIKFFIYYRIKIFTIRIWNENEQW